MFKKGFFLFICFTSSLIQAFEFPSEFYVTERMICLSRAFDIETDQYKLGSVYRRLWDLGTAYDFYDKDENILASARMRWVTVGAVFDVVEFPNENPIGRVVEEIFTWF